MSMLVQAPKIVAVTNTAAQLHQHSAVQLHKSDVSESDEAEMYHELTVYDRHHMSYLNIVKMYIDVTIGEH